MAHKAEINGNKLSVNLDRLLKNINSINLVQDTKSVSGLDIFDSSIAIMQ